MARFRSRLGGARLGLSVHVDPLFSRRPPADSRGLSRLRPSTKPLTAPTRERPAVPKAAPPPDSTERSGPGSGARNHGLFPGGGTTTLVSVTLDAGSNLLESVHAFITQYATGRFTSSVAQAISVAAYELLENALSYASLTAPVTLQLISNEGEPEVCVSNVAVPSRLNVLRELLDALSRDAQGVFVEQMRRSIVGHQRATLGLARIAHEANMQLAMIVDGDRVCVRAHHRLRTYA